MVRVCGEGVGVMMACGWYVYTMYNDMCTQVMLISIVHNLRE